VSSFDKFISFECIVSDLIQENAVGSTNIKVSKLCSHPNPLERWYPLMNNDIVQGKILLSSKYEPPLEDNWPEPNEDLTKNKIKQRRIP